ncbi:calcium-binding protein, partial [Snodgrassella sp. CFCC 13594]|uniref:calcium-binding protein n=1 Tax=Snodgrassella sp. CFCC 13594 TaxID=1775559 RepID=UPI0026F44F08
LGNDTYVFDADWGNDVITDHDGQNAIKFTSLKSENAKFIRDGFDLLISDDKTSNTVRVKNQFDSTDSMLVANSIQSIQFADGISLDIA